MSKFQIVPTEKGEEKQGGYTVLNVHTLGDTARQLDNIRYNGRVGENKHKWLTGLKPEHIDFARGLSKEQKETFKKQLAKDLEVLNLKYSSEEYDETNSYFWKERKMGEIILDTSIENTYFDTELNPDHIIIKYAIIAGSYDLVASNRELARSVKAPYYMTSLEEEQEREFTPINDKLLAGSKLYEFLKTANEQNVLWFAWALDKDTRGFSGTNSKSVIATKLVEFLEGNLTKSKASKKQCAGKILSLLNAWETNKENVIVTAVFYAAINYGIIFYDKGFYYTAERRTKLLPSPEDSIQLLLDPVLRDELKEIQTAVKAELNK